MSTSYSQMCRTYWSGGHLCMKGRGHSGEHDCASTACPSLHLVAACWGEDAGSDAFGELPRGAAPDKPFRQLKRAA